MSRSWLLALPLDVWGGVLALLDDCPVALGRLRATCRQLCHDLATPQPSVDPAWLRVLSHLDPAGSLLRAFDAPPLQQYLDAARRCSGGAAQWGSLAAALTAAGCAACGAPTPYLHYAPRMPLARRCRGCRGRTPAHGPSSGTEVTLVNSALFGRRAPTASVASEAQLLGALAAARHGDTIGVVGRVASELGHGWGGESLFGSSVRLLGIGQGAGLHVRDNCIYLGSAALLENLQLTTTDRSEEYESKFFAGFWGAGVDVVLKDCTIVGGSGSALVVGGEGSLRDGGPFRCGAIRCTFDAPRNGIFAAMLDYSITRFLGCTFVQTTSDFCFCDFMLVEDPESDACRGLMAMLARRNRFPGALAPVVHDLRGRRPGLPQYFVLF
jgi:hypothetical protein